MKVALIGMPTSGKSTISQRLIKQLSYSLIDLDPLLEKRFKMTLQNFINTEGEAEFLMQESNLMIEINYPKNCIISTGGSVIYATSAMDKLKNDGIHFVYLKVPIKVLEERLANQRDIRGVIMNGSKTWNELFVDRDHLYNHYADTVIDTSSKSIDEICDEIIGIVK